MNINDLVYHAVRQQVRRVLTAMSNDQIELGLTAFEDGGSNWSECFFARALPELNLACCLTDFRATQMIANRLNIGSNVPVRIVWTLFDGVGEQDSASMTKAQLRSFIEAVREDRRPDEVRALLASLTPTQMQEFADASAR